MNATVTELERARDDDAAPAVERRKGNQLLIHWQSLRDGRPLPRLADVRPEMVPALWRFCFIAEFRPDGLVFSYVGHAVNRGYGMGDGPQKGGISEVLHALLEGPCREVETTAEPCLFDGEAPNRWGDTLRYRGSACPISQDGATVSHVLGLIDYVEMKREVVQGVQIETDINPDGA